MSVGQPSVDSLVCYCYEVTEAQIRHFIETFDTQTVEEVTRHTGAGNGCTACHCRIRRMLAGLPATCGASDTCSTCGFSACSCECNVA
jgi:bacterioferritin-associated ferredoxin